tara:strand:+ start:229 stop:474 length:246 start_codon:yes stop_codon:yes gene_type:complete
MEDEKFERFITTKRLFEDISQKFTPEFSGEDWLKLYERAIQGDPISTEMIIELWLRKVDPYLNPECQFKLKEDWYKLKGDL